MFFHLLFVANDFALREQGVSQVNDAGVAADEAACVEKRSGARKSANIRSTRTAAANGGTFGWRHIASLQRQWSTATVAVARAAYGAESGGALRSAQTRKARSLSERFPNDWICRANLNWQSDQVTSRAKRLISAIGAGIPRHLCAHQVARFTWLCGN